MQRFFFIALMRNNFTAVFVETLKQRQKLTAQNA